MDPQRHPCGNSPCLGQRGSSGRPSAGGPAISFPPGTNSSPIEDTRRRSPGVLLFRTVVSGYFARDLLRGRLFLYGSLGQVMGHIRARGQDTFHRKNKLLLHGWQIVSVDVQHHANIGMPQASGYRLDVLRFEQRERGVRVPQVMKANGGHLGLEEKPGQGLWAIALAEILLVTARKPASPRREYQVALALTAPVPEYCYRPPGQPDSAPTGSRLDFLDADAASVVCAGRPGDSNNAALQIHLGPFQHGV